MKFSAFKNILENTFRATFYFVCINLLITENVAIRCM